MMAKNIKFTTDNRPSEVSTSLYGFIFHYYRAEVYRETNWRNRLDNTTNWSVITSAAILTFAFADNYVPHSVILINFLIVWFFLYIESRRFRYYSILRDRTRLIEKQLLGPVFLGETAPLKEKEWQKQLADSFKSPHIGMSRLESVAWRMRRNYIIIFPILFLAWITKVFSYPQVALTLDDALNNARILFIPGKFVFYGFVIVILFTISLAFYIPQTSHHDDLP